MKKLSAVAAILLIIMLFIGSVPAFAAQGESPKLIALTFDDGPGQYTPELLDGLRERNAHVTFFMLGQNAAYYPETVRRAWEEGHQICSHTYGHRDLKELSYTDVRNEIELTDAALDNAIGQDLSYWLRPPYGSYDDTVLNRVGVPCVYWSVDTLDWQSLSSSAAYTEFINSARDGAIVLMHDIHKTTIPAALSAIDTLMQEGYEFVTVSELLARRGITAGSGKMYFYAYPGDNDTESALREPIIKCDHTDDGKRVFIRGDERAKIYYTTDGSIPTPGNSRLYEEPFLTAEDTAVRAVCVRNWNGERSEVVTETTAPTPLNVTLATPQSNAKSHKAHKAPQAHDGQDEPMLGRALAFLALCSVVLIGSFIIRPRKR